MIIALFQRVTTLLTALVLSGCATIFSSGPESIEVKSDPSGAKFKFGSFSGTTPTTISVPRKALKEHSSVYFTKEGYEDMTVPIQTRIQDITWLGILFWPSIVIDIANANAYQLDTPHVTASLVTTQNKTVNNADMKPTSNAPSSASVHSVMPPQNTEQRDTKNITTEGPFDANQLQAGVVRITAKSSAGMAKLGTGFIVKLEKDTAYIVTAAHVVAGDPQPKVEFFTRRNTPAVTEVLGLEGDDEVRGLALVVVRGQENLPKGLKALELVETMRLAGGEDIIMIGFPRNAGPWAVVKGNISSRQGRDLYFSPTVESGHSGGPILHNGKVVGVVAAAGSSLGRGIIARSVHDYVEGFGITIQEHVTPRFTEPSSVPDDPTRPDTVENTK